jgi:acylphosphatase
MTDRKRLDATVHGRVQGVGFRWFVRRSAARLGLVGWVANDASGSVRLVAEGEATAVDQLIVDLHEGPPGAVVDRVATSFQTPTSEFTGFEIRARGHAGD